MGGPHSRFVGRARHRVSALVLGAYINISAGAAFGAEWAGVDETVIERYAQEAGRRPRASFINTDQGDLLLFVFLIAGVAGGFIMGYYWRALFKDVKKRLDEGNRNQD